MNRSEQLRLAYTEALAQLRQHPSLIWTRNNFFLLINSGLFAFAISNPTMPLPGSSILIPVAGAFLSAVWLWVNVASQRLQRQWRHLVLEIELELFHPTAGEQPVEGPFARATKTAKEGSSPGASITSALVILSGGFLVCWIWLLGVAAVRMLCAD